MHFTKAMRRTLFISLAAGLACLHFSFGEPLARLSYDLPFLWRATLDAKPETPAGWFAARCTGGPSMTNPTQPAFAHTAPQFTGVAGRKTDATIFRRAVLSTIDWAETAGRYRDAKFRDKLLANAADALARLAAND